MESLYVLSVLCVRCTYTDAILVRKGKVWVAAHASIRGLKGRMFVFVKESHSVNAWLGSQTSGRELGTRGL